METNNANRSPPIPGFRDTPLDYELPLGSRFARGFEWQQVPPITKRELVMVAAMNDLTDKPNWHTDIFRPDVVKSWRDELRASTPLMSDKAWEWCVAELRDKAVRYAEVGYLSVLDTGSRVCKSDTLVSQDLCDEIRLAFRSRLAGLGLERDTRGGVSYLIDPSSHPLVWGKSLVITSDGDGNGDLPSPQQAPAHQDKRTEVHEIQKRLHALVTQSTRRGWHPANRVFKEWKYPTMDYLWSYKYQWLPCDVEFTDAEDKAEVHITSYINGLSSVNTEESSLDGMLEKLISLSIEPLNECLIEGRQEWSEGIEFLPLAEDGSGTGWQPPGGSEWPQRGRVPCRIITYGVEWENTAPEWLRLFDTINRRKLKWYLTEKKELEERLAGDSDALRAAQLALEEKHSEVFAMEPLPELTDAHRDLAREFVLRQVDGVDWRFLELLGEGWETNDGELGRACHLKLYQSLRYKHPEPGTAFSYEEWKSGTHGGRAVVDMVTDRPINPAKSPPSTPHEPYLVRLQGQFRAQGLQVIIRAQEIVLEPGLTPESTGGDWGLAGMNNEHIVAVSMFAYDVQNATDVRVSYRQHTDVQEGFLYNQEEHRQDRKGDPHGEPIHRTGITWGREAEATAEVLGFDPMAVIGHTAEVSEYARSIQEIGSVALRQGRLVAFPNTMEHRLEGCKLIDEEKEGHVRWVTLMLVDPNYRICSTKNVPQQHFSREETSEYAREMDEEHTLASYAHWFMTYDFYLD